jgi:hypothetical protein
VSAPAARGARQRSGNIDAFVVLDESGSMKPIFSRVLAYLADALVRDYLVPGDYFLLLGFSDLPRVRVSQRLASAWEKQNLAEIVRNLNVVPQGYTDMGRALEASLGHVERLADPSHQQVVLILTDGLNQPPRDSPYFEPTRPDPGKGFAPPSRFNARFHERVRALAGKGYRIHVVGIGLETDARALAEALGSSYTILREFEPKELEAGLGAFWDDALNLEGLTAAATWLPEQDVLLTARIRSSSDKDREVQLKAVAASLPGVSLDPATPRWAVPARKQADFAVRARLGRGFPAGDHRLRVSFEQQSAVKFYPPQAELSFHVPSFWERHGAKVVSGGAAASILLIAGILYHRRPIAIALVTEGEAAGRPVRLALSGACSIGGGATDRLRIPGLPQKVATFERRSVERFAIVSSRPELVPTVPEYALGEPVVVRGGEQPRVVRFVRATRRAASALPRPSPVAKVPPPSRPGSPPSGIDFR